MDRGCGQELGVLLGLACGIFTGVFAADAPPPDAGTGIVISPDDPATVLKGVQAAIKAGLASIKIPPGVYRIPPLPTGGGPDAWHLIFENAKNLEIDATGVTLVFTDRARSSMTFQHCDGVTFKGATLLRATLPCSQGRIEALSMTANTLDVRIAKGYPDDLDNRAFFDTFWPNVYDAATRQWKTYIRAATPPVMERLEPGLFRVHMEPLSQAAAPLSVGDLLAWRGAVFSDLRVFECRNMKITGVTVLNGAGFCFQESGGDGGNVYEKCSVTFAPRPAGADEAQLQASNADGFHSNDAKQGPTLLGCSFEAIGDDAIALHGTYAMVLEASENKVIALRIAQTRNKELCRPGDALRFYDTNMVLAGVASVTAVKSLPDYKTTFDPGAQFQAFRGKNKVGYFELTLDHAIAAQPSWLFANESDNGNGFVIRDCVVRNTTSRGIIAKSSKGVIEGCTFDGLARAAIEFNTETGIWSESDFAHDVVIRNNIIRHASWNRRVGLLRHPGALAIFAHKGKAYAPNPGGHRNITIENNRFEENDGVNILICSAQDVIIRNNQFIKPMTNADEFGVDKGADPGALIWLNESSKLELSGNTVEHAGAYMNRTVGATATASGVGFDTGVRVNDAPPPHDADK